MKKINEEIAHEWKNIIKRGLCAFIIPIISMLYPITNRYKSSAKVFHMAIDDKIPFIKYFIIPYLSWYFYVGFFLIFICFIDDKQYYELLLSMVIGMLISYLVFYIFPTHVSRPVIVENDIFSKMVKRLYKIDNPFSCFPSIHVLNSVLVALNVGKEKYFKKSTKIVSWVLCVFIVLSTMFVKQHYFVDVLAGGIFAVILYLVVGSINITSYMNKLLGIKRKVY